MNPTRIAVTSPSFCKNAELVSRLQAAYPDAKLNSAGKKLESESLIEFLRGASAAIIGTEKVTATLLKGCPDLKQISKYGVGLDNIDFDACKSHGVEVRWTAGVNRRSVSELALADMISLLRNAFETAVQLRLGHWNKSGGTQLTGKTVGIIGLGNVGQDLVSLLKPFDCQILANDIADRIEFANKHGIRLASKEEIYRECDVITLHVPLTTETRNLIGAPEFKLMKTSAILINTARGGIVDESALKRALRDRVIAGAALDSYVEEPLSDTELTSFPNLITTPHIGGNAMEAVLAMGNAAIENLLSFTTR